MSVWDDIRAEADRAHAKHGDTSMRSEPIDSPWRLAILMEEVGEVAREFNDARHEGEGPAPTTLREELTQLAAMAGDWAQSIEIEGY